MTSEAHLEILDDMIEKWHLENAGPDLELHEYLGLTPKEFVNWVHNDELPEGWQPPNA